MTASPKSETVAANPSPATAAPAPAPAPARVGMAPDQLYRAICIACHDADGRGKLVRVAMPAIPDLTDPKWQASRTDAELQHSILEGKGLLMLPMKDKLALAHTDVKEMIAFMRSFGTGNPLAAAGSPAPASAASPTPAVPPVLTATTGLTSPAPSASPATPPATTNLVASPLPSASPLAATAPRGPLTQSRSTAASPENSAKLRAAGDFYTINCVACHGPDGRGTAAVRVAMPALPDFSNREWNTSRENPQLAISVLEGKGTLMPPWRGRVDPGSPRTSSPSSGPSARPTWPPPTHRRASWEAVSNNSGSDGKSSINRPRRLAAPDRILPTPPTRDPTPDPLRPMNGFV